MALTWKASTRLSTVPAPSNSSATRGRPVLLNDIAGEWAVQRLQWFTKGFYRVREDEQGIVLTDLRMGQEPFYVFSFRVGRRASPQIVPVFPQQVPPERVDLESLIWIWNRIMRRF